MRRDAHKHRCTTCQQSYACPGTLSFNFDGWPTTLCSAWDEQAIRECEECYHAEACANCGKKHVQLAAGTYGYRVCAECFVGTAVEA